MCDYYCVLHAPLYYTNDETSWTTSHSHAVYTCKSTSTRVAGSYTIDNKLVHWFL